jgi:hypothetical protein
VSLDSGKVLAVFWVLGLGLLVDGDNRPDDVPGSLRVSQRLYLGLDIIAKLVAHVVEFPVSTSALHDQNGVLLTRSLR